MSQHFIDHPIAFIIFRTIEILLNVIIAYTIIMLCLDYWFDLSHGLNVAIAIGSMFTYLLAALALNGDAR